MVAAPVRRPQGRSPWRSQAVMSAIRMTPPSANRSIAEKQVCRKDFASTLAAWHFPQGRACAALGCGTWGVSLPQAVNRPLTNAAVSMESAFGSGSPGAPSDSHTRHLGSGANTLGPSFLWLNISPRYRLASRQALVFTLIQSPLPERYGASLRFDTMPSMPRRSHSASSRSPLRHKRTGPIRDCRAVPQADPVRERSAPRSTIHALADKSLTLGVGIKLARR